VPNTPPRILDSDFCDSSVLEVPVPHTPPLETMAPKSIDMLAGDAEPQPRSPARLRTPRTPAPAEQLAAALEAAKRKPSDIPDDGSKRQALGAKLDALHGVPPMPLPASYPPGVVGVGHVGGGLPYAAVPPPLPMPFDQNAMLTQMQHLIENGIEKSNRRICEKIDTSVATLHETQVRLQQSQEKLLGHMEDFNDRLGKLESHRVASDAQVELIASRVAVLESAAASGPSNQIDIKALKTELMKELRTELAKQNLRPISAAPLPNGKAPPFEPEVLFLKGWCRWGQELTGGLSEDEALVLAQMMMTHVPPDMSRWFSDKYRAPYYRNRQVAIDVMPGAPPGIARKVADLMNEKIKAHGLTAFDKTFWAAPDIEPWKKARNAELGRAKATLENEISDLTGIEFKFDWAAGILFAKTKAAGQGKTVEGILGRWSRTRGWAWNAQGLHAVFGQGLDVAAIEAAHALSS
jgi:hypothetical protein